ncbi:MAG: hypothetical protein WA952_20040 [Lewinella sp.]
MPARARCSSVDLAISRPVCAGRGEAVLSVTNIFNDFGLRQETDGESSTARYENLYESQVVRLGFTCKF